MGARHLTALVGAATVVSLAQLVAPVPPASAQPCPDAEVVFARGTTEDPGVGPEGQAFVDALRAKAGTKSIGVYPVDYPATTDFPTALDGINDASAHIRSTVANCPNTKLVLGGFSQGAAVMGFVTANVIPDGAPASGVPNPMPPDVANHVAAVALLGKPNTRFMRAINEPQIAIGPLYEDKTLELCIPDDPICSTGTDFNEHMQYVPTGLVDQAATFAAGHLVADSGPAGHPQLPGPAAPAQLPGPAAPAQLPGPATLPQPPAPAASPQQLTPAAPPQQLTPTAPPQQLTPAAPPQPLAPAAPAQPPAPAAPPQSPAPAAPPQPQQLAPGTLLSCTTVCHVIGPT